MRPARSRLRNRSRERAGRMLYKKDRNADAHRNRDDQSDDRRNRRTVDKGQRAEFLAHRIPYFAPDEAPAEPVETQSRVSRHLHDHQPNQSGYRERKQKRYQLEYLI